MIEEYCLNSSSNIERISQMQAKHCTIQFLLCILKIGRVTQDWSPGYSCWFWQGDSRKGLIVNRTFPLRTFLIQKLRKNYNSRIQGIGNNLDIPTHNTSQLWYSKYRSILSSKEIFSYNYPASGNFYLGSKNTWSYRCWEFSFSTKIV